MAAAVILFSFIFIQNIDSQCIDRYTFTGSMVFRGVENSIDSYFRNYIIQDIGLAENIPFNDVAIRFDYQLYYSVNQCGESYLELSAKPVSVRCHPISYRGFDISSSVMPGKADLFFKVYNEMGILADSIIFYGIPIGSDTSLYTLQQLPKDFQDGRMTAAFSRAIFYYTRSSYDIFRDRLLQVDRYYAASQIADSAMKWTRSGLLEEVDDLDGLCLRHFELDRIIRMTDAELQNHNSVPDQADSLRLGERMTKLKLLDRRYRTLVLIKSQEPAGFYGLDGWNSLAEEYCRYLEYYNSLAISGDFRDIEFLEELASPSVTNAKLILTRNRFLSWDIEAGNRLAELAQAVIMAFIRQGEINSVSGNQIRALEYFESAFKIAILSGNASSSDGLFNKVCQTKKEIIDSYLAISRKALLANNPGMAVSYYKNAVNLLDHKRTGLCSKITMGDFSKWLYGNLEIKAREMLASGQYAKALQYLDEIQSECASNEDFTCPGDLPEQVRKARYGLYMDLLARSKRYFDMDELADAANLLQQARDMRLKDGVNIPADATELKLDNAFRQISYMEYIEEGIRNMDWQEYDVALYYFNKAEMLENESLQDPSGSLGEYRQAAARQVIDAMMSDTRAKVIAYDFEGYQEMMRKVSAMMEEYRFNPADTLMEEYRALQDDAMVSLCQLAKEQYGVLLDEVLKVKNDGEYIHARKLAEEAVQYSLDHLECGIDDSRAWYEKVVLEPMAVFQEKEKALRIYDGITPKQYQAVYQSVSSYYYRNKLISQGISLESIFVKVLYSEDVEFLKRYLDQYIYQRNLEQGLAVLKRLQVLGLEASYVAEEQRQLAGMFASRDVILSSGEEPWVLLDGYIGKDKWFWNFRWSYRMTWIGKSGGKMKDWPVIWKK